MEGRGNAGLSSRAANKEDGSELSLGEADKEGAGEEADIERKDSELSLGEANKEGEGEAADKRKITPSYHSEKRTKRGKTAN